MNKILSWTVLAVLLMSCNTQVNGQASEADGTPSTREDRILDNLRYQIPQLREVMVLMGPITSSDIDGLDQGSFTVNGQQSFKYLVTSDDVQLFLLAADPIDVSRSSEEIAAGMEEERQGALVQARERHDELTAFASGMPVRGNPDAPVTIFEFSDFQCPYCARGFTTMEQILEEHPDDVKFVYLHFPLQNHPWAKPAAIASICAAQQDEEAFWTLHDSYFQNQRAINASNVMDMTRDFLADFSLDFDTWATCAEDPTSSAYQGAALAVETAMSTGSKYGVTGTPAFFVNGQFLSGAQPREAFNQAIEQAKKDALQ